MEISIQLLRFTSQYNNKRWSRNVGDRTSFDKALEFIQKTLLEPFEVNDISDKIDETESLKQNSDKTGVFGNPNLNEKQVYHSIVYLGWLIFFSFSSIFGALAPLAMQMNRNFDEEAHNHIPGGTFQI